MKKIFLTSGLLLSANTFAHVSSAGYVQHSNEHMLFGALLIPVAWLIARKIFSK